MKYSTFLFAGLFLILACKNPAPEQEEKAPETTEKRLTFLQKSLNKESATCSTDSMKCASIKVNYLVAENTDASVLKNINDSLQYFFANSIMLINEGDIPTTNLGQLADNYIKDYEQFLSESGDEDYVTPWEIETESQVLFQDEKRASVMIGTYSYLGGAHPNHFTSLINFDVTTGKTLQVEDIVTDRIGLMKMAEKAFKEAREMPEEEDLTEAGFFWGDGFHLPANIGIEEEGLYFYYNPYEAAAYALGPTDFTISWEELKPILK